jgi:high-affinity iron transporter
MKEIELEMREELRQKIREERSPQEIANFITIILSKLDKDLLKNDPSYNLKTNTSLSSTSRSSFADIEGLRQGLGTYAGQTWQMGEASVRNSVDQIRFKLSDMLKVYQNQNYGGALLTAQSAYLDSYETIEIPLRPIDPDFTLEMEIKIANLRNLIQQHSEQELGVVPITPLVGIVPRLDINLATMTGIHPTLESVIAQCTWCTSISIPNRFDLHTHFEA